METSLSLKGKKTGPLKQVDNQTRHEVSDCGKGKGIVFNETDQVGCSSRCNVNATSSSDDQKRIDEMLAACIDMEENAKLVNNVSNSLGGSTNKEKDGNYDEDEEMILPAMHSEVDPAVLASLPPSMQLDLLVQMRERLMAENRQKYQKVKKDPSKFSELQIQSYLKTVAFRREINEVQKAAVGGGVGGIQTSRIASEANREYIFSSSFSGDKQGLTSTRLERNVEDTQQMERGRHPSQNFINNIAAENVSNISAGLVCGEPCEPVDESIETYLDERGRVRVSRSRAMGMRMTRDIQRNLDLMKEIQHDRTHTSKVDNIDTVPNTENSPSKCSGSQLSGKTREVNIDLAGDNVQNEELMLGKNTSIEISFEYDCKDELASGGDDIFASLVGGISMEHSHADDTVVKTPCGSDSDCDWEEGILQGKNTISPGYNKVELKSSVTGEYDNNESEEEWEDGDCNGTKSTLFCPSEPGMLASKGQLEEESDLQEAIRRSLESTWDGKLKCVPSLDEHSNAYEKKLDPNLEHGDNSEALGDKNANYMTRNDPETFHQLKSSVTFKSKNSDTLINEPSKLDGLDNSENSISDGNDMMMDEVPNLIVAEELLDNHNDGGMSKVDPLGVTEEEKKKSNDDSEALSNSSDNTKAAILSMEPSVKGAKEDLDLELKLPSVNNDGNLCMERTSNLSQESMITPGDFPVLLDEVQLNEEMEILDREYMNLEKEQKKFERNAESVDSELFTECQELLQMFGLPYIIAPMEAEAQCAYLELSKLVDGVVTDDSDVLLFGARSVYKNIFDDRKYVETYFMEDIEKELGLTREKLIRMALLLGSDYTEGVSGIGIVNAIEVVTAFPEEDGFQKFRQWVESPDPTILGRSDTKSVSKKGSKLEEKESPDYIQERKQIFMDKHRNVSKNWHIPSSFPSETVISAYLSPEVDRSTEPFAWGKPDQLVLRKMCWEKFGWSSQKADELLLPVLKQYNKHATQLRLEAFYSFNEKFAKIRSKRINKALKGITGKPPSEGAEEEEGLAGRKKSKRKESMERKNDRDVVAKQHTKKKKINDVSTSTHGASEVEKLQPCMQTEEEPRNKSGSGRGRGKGVRVKRSREKKGRCFQSEAETSSSSSDIENHEPGVHIDGPTVTEAVRRSKRSRKPVNYSFEDLEVEDAVDSFDQNNQTCLRGEGLQEKSSCIDDASVDSFSRGIESNMIEIPVKDNLPANYLEPDTDAGAATPNTRPLDDYLEMGGGFCADDSEMDKNHDAIDDMNTATTISPGCSEFLGETDRDKSSSDILFSGTEKVTSEIQDGETCHKLDTVPNDHLNAGIRVLTPENAHHNSESSEVAFSAMPFLRKKRKR
ncbi:DNA repair protein uvh3, variant 2 [Lathyrus oleraceus]|uniref:DNA repair protein uvh3, variant 2 n=1 Tax=Pisum sativum TaxID=3888 RepID=A0A9D4Y024_PEA|nr:DNA repair protein uvh3, variant 2 [Pisum sativum]